MVRTLGFYCQGLRFSLWLAKLRSGKPWGVAKKKKEDKEKILQEQPQMLRRNSMEYLRILRTLGKTLKRVLPQNWGKLRLESALLWAHLTKLNHRT